MRLFRSSALSFSLIVAATATLSCGPDAHPPATVTPPLVDAGPPVASTALPTLPVRVLRTGEIPPKVAPKITLVPRGRQVFGGSQLTDYALPKATRQGAYNGAVVHIDGPGAAFVETNADGEAILWVRRPASAASAPIDGHLYTTYGSGSAEPGTDQPFTADAQAKLAGPPERDVVGDWLGAAISALDDRTNHRFYSADAVYRLKRLQAKEHPPKPTAPGKSKSRLTKKQQDDELRSRTESARREAQSELDDRIGVLSGATGVAAAAALGNGVGGGAGLAAEGRRRVPFDQVKPLVIAPIPWNQLTAVGAPPPEPLASVVPAEFYYARATDIASLQQVLATVEKWANAADRAVDGSAADDQIVTRYETALGVQPGELVRLLGGTAVGEVALVGSDLYLAEGSDLSLILAVKSQPLVDAALGGALAARASAHGEVKETTREHAGVTVTESRTADDAVRRQRAVAGGRTILSTSAVAMDRILDTLAGQHPRLADEPDFQHLLARDPMTGVSAILFAGDRFFSEVTGPRQRILESRRRIARDELIALGESALLYGWCFGQEPRSEAEILRAGLLVTQETRHSSGEAITFVPGSAPRSAWGTPSELAPLLDMPTPTTVSSAEVDAYQRFATSYRNLWNEHLDPLMVRFTVDGPTTTVDLRQMPVPWTAEYRDFSTVAGDVHLAVPPLGKGARFTAAIGKDSELRRLANDFAGSKNDKLKNALDWIGDSADIGVLDDPYLTADSGSIAYRASILEPPVKDTSSVDDRVNDKAVMEPIFRTPVYASIDVGNPITAGLVVATLRKEVEDELKDDIVWREVGKEGDATILGIEVKSDRGWFTDAHLYYSFASGALVLAFREDVLRTIIRERQAGTKALAVPAKQRSGAQHVLELAHDKTGALASGLLWLAEVAALESDHGDSVALADYIYRGAPSVDADPAAFAQLAAAYLGGVPRPVDGGVFTFGLDGVKDPWRGTPSHPVWPTLPVPHSEATRAVTDLSRLRAELSFDPEGQAPLALGPGRRPTTAAETPPRSLHARLTFTSFAGATD